MSVCEKHILRHGICPWCLAERLKNRMRRLLTRAIKAEAENAALKAYAGDNYLKSDYQTAADMRFDLERVKDENAELRERLNSAVLKRLLDASTVRIVLPEEG